MLSGAHLPIPPEGVALSRTAAPPWITAELIEQTIRVWQPYYAHPLTPDDAITMLLNVGTLWRALSEEVRS